MWWNFKIGLCGIINTLKTDSPHLPNWNKSNFSAHIQHYGRRNIPHKPKSYYSQQSIVTQLQEKVFDVENTWWLGLCICNSFIFSPIMKRQISSNLIKLRSHHSAFVEVIIWGRKYSAPLSSSQIFACVKVKCFFFSSVNTKRKSIPNLLLNSIEFICCK